MPEEHLADSPAGPAIPATMQPVQEPAAFQGRAARRYVTAFLVLGCLALAGTFVLPTASWYYWHNLYAGAPWLGYSERAPHANCEVLIYGDSTALTGLDPAIIQQRTGLKACNIAEVAGVQYFVGSELPLQEYLRSNEPPKFIVTMWFAAIFRPEVPAYLAYFPEGAIWVTQSQSHWQLLLQILRRPMYAVRFSVFSAQALLQELIREIIGPGGRQRKNNSRRDQQMGYLPFSGPAETACHVGKTGDIPAWYGPQQRWQENVNSFRKRFSSPQTTVLVDMSPVPECAEGFAAEAAINEGLSDNRFERLPLRFFNEGDKHFSREGGVYLSNEAADQIVALMRTSATPGRAGTENSRR